MTPSELAFMGLGLLLGAASGAALIVVLGSRPPRREIRVTVAHDAVPRRSETLSHGAFASSAAEPARGGPADRRSLDRDLPPSDPAAPAGIPVMAQSASEQRAPVATEWRPSDDLIRTSVPFAAERPAPLTAVVPVERAHAGGGGGAVLPEVRTSLEPAAPGSASRLERIVRGDHLAMVELVDAVAGQDSARRRDWEVLLGGFVEALADMATREFVIDFPMGTAFWDTFTVEQCRQVVAALSTMGFRYDGRSGWAEQRAPAYRDLSLALADIGQDPRRIRAWPNQAEIAALFVGARPAPEELLAAAGPGYGTDDVKALVGERAAELASLWLAWDDVRPVLLGGAAPAVALA